MILNAADRDSRGSDFCHAQIPTVIFLSGEHVVYECLTDKQAGAIAVDRFEIGKMEYWAI
jgi:hypothetical protein